MPLQFDDHADYHLQHCIVVHASMDLVDLQIAIVKLETTIPTTRGMRREWIRKLFLYEAASDEIQIFK